MPRKRGPKAPPGGKNISKTISLPPALWNKIDEWADARNMTRSQLVFEAIQVWIMDLESGKMDKETKNSEE